MLRLVSCYYMTSFNYGGKKARDVSPTCRCHLSNIMPDSIFYDSMAWWMTQIFFLRGVNLGLLQNRRDEFSLITIAPLCVGKP